MTRRAAVALLFAPLVLAAPAHGATTIGSTHMSQTSPGGVECGDAACPVLALHESVDGTQVTTPAGVVVRFRVKGEGPLTLAVFRASTRGATLAASRVAVGGTAPGAGAGTVVETATRVPLAAGDMVGMVVPSGSVLSALDVGNSTAWLAADAPAINVPQTEVGELLYQADIEPDADVDGFGDETQDKCLGQAGANAGCAAATPPPPPPPPPVNQPFVGAVLQTSIARVSRSGNTRLRVQNPNATAVELRITLKYRGRSAGSRLLTLVPRETRTINFKVSLAARRALRRVDLLRLPMTLKTRAGTSSRNSTKTLTLR